MKNIKFLVAIFLLIGVIIVTNLPVLKPYMPKHEAYTYSANKYDFTSTELEGIDDPVGKVEFELYEYQILMRNSDHKLYRNFDRKWWQVWNWYDYLTNRRWFYPHVSHAKM